MNNNWVHNCVDFCMNNVFHVHMYIQFILSRIGLLAFLVPLVIFLRCVTYTLCYIQAIQQFKLTHCKVSLHLNSWSNILTISTQNLVCCCCYFFLLFSFAFPRCPPWIWSSNISNFPRPTHRFTDSMTIHVHVHVYSYCRAAVTTNFTSFVM